MENNLVRVSDKEVINILSLDGILNSAELYRTNNYIYAICSDGYGKTEIRGIDLNSKTSKLLFSTNEYIGKACIFKDDLCFYTYDKLIKIDKDGLTERLLSADVSKNEKFCGITYKNGIVVLSDKRARVINEEGVVASEYDITVQFDYIIE